MALEIIIILSLIQGITEFLPISSSAHLIIIPEFFLNIDSSRGFDVSLHFGSLLAVIYYLKKDLMKIISDTMYFKIDNEGFIILKNLIINEKLKEFKKKIKTKYEIISVYSNKDIQKIKKLLVNYVN